MESQVTTAELMRQTAASVHTIESFARALLADVIASAAKVNADGDVVEIPARITVGPGTVVAGRACLRVTLCYEDEDAQQSVCREVSIC